MGDCGMVNVVWCGGCGKVNVVCSVWYGECGVGDCGMVVVVW